MNETEYILEIFKPESTTEIEFKYSASSPFITISRGDLINPMKKDGTHVFRVTNVEHYVYVEGEKLIQKIEVYTMAVKDTHELRTI